MDTATAKRIVIGSTVAIVVASQVRRIANGDGPTVRAPVGGLFVAAGLTALAGPAPDVAAQLALIALVAEVVVDGPYVLGAAGKAVQARPATAPIASGMNAAARALVDAVGTADGTRWWSSALGSPATALSGAGSTIAGGVSSAEAAAAGMVKFTAATGQQITAAPEFALPLAGMISDALADGVRLTGKAWRSSAEQIQLRKAHCPDWQNSPASACSPPTAKPGTSHHEDGTAIDFDNARTRSTPAYRWLAANAGRYGIHNLPSEPWHWSLSGG